VARQTKRKNSVIPTLTLWLTSVISKKLQRKKLALRESSQNQPSTGAPRESPSALSICLTVSQGMRSRMGTHLPSRVGAATPSDREKSQLYCSATCNIDKQDAIVDDEQFKLGADLEKAIPWQIFVLPFGVPFLYNIQHIS